MSTSPLGRLLLLTGARQTGKTTLLRNLFADFAYISFDDPFVRSQFALLSAEEFFSRFPCAILDEVQKMPSMFDTVKAAHDAHPECRYVLSGSSQILLGRHVTETMAGRVSIFELQPLSLPECLTTSWTSPIRPSRWMRLLDAYDDAEKILLGMPSMDAAYPEAVRTWERYVSIGGMPALWNDDARLSDDECRKWLKDYSATYLQRDVRDLVQLRYLEPFVLAQKALAAQTGGILNMSNLARDAGIAPSTASRFLQYLESSYQVVVLRPWFANSHKRLVKSPKLHFADPGVLRIVAGIEGTLPGNAFESAVVAELHKQMRLSGTDSEAFFLRTADGLEVDFVVSTARGYILVEVKQSVSASFHDARHLMSAESILDKPILCRLVVSQDPNPRSLAKNTFAVPAAWLLG